MNKHTPAKDILLLSSSLYHTTIWGVSRRREPRTPSTRQANRQTWHLLKKNGERERETVVVWQVQQVILHEIHILFLPLQLSTTYPLGCNQFTHTTVTPVQDLTRGTQTTRWRTRPYIQQKRGHLTHYNRERIVEAHIHGTNQYTTSVWYQPGSPTGNLETADNHSRIFQFPPGREKVRNKEINVTSFAHSSITYNPNFQAVKTMDMAQ